MIKHELNLFIVSKEGAIGCRVECENLTKLSWYVAYLAHATLRACNSLKLKHASKKVVGGVSQCSTHA